MRPWSLKKAENWGLKSSGGSIGELRFPPIRTWDGTTSTKETAKMFTSTKKHRWANYLADLRHTWNLSTILNQDQGTGDLIYIYIHNINIKYIYIFIPIIPWYLNFNLIRKVFTPVVFLSFLKDITVDTFQTTGWFSSWQTFENEKSAASFDSTPLWANRTGELPKAESSSNLRIHFRKLCLTCWPRSSRRPVGQVRSKRKESQGMKKGDRWDQWVSYNYNPK